jgi:hypothetical protein
MAKELLKATHEGKLRIGETTFHCAVLENGERLLVEASLFLVFKSEDDRQARLNILLNGDGSVQPVNIGNKDISPFLPSELQPIACCVKYISIDGYTRLGLPGVYLPRLCNAILAARDAGQVDASLEYIVKQADVLTRGLAEVGITALIDEATGYQEVREKDALAKILEKYLNERAAAWAQTFPDEFYRQLFRLRGWHSPDILKRPSCVGKDTNDLIYKRIAPGIFAELQERNPKNKRGNRSNKHHQHFTGNFGYPALKEHIDKVVLLMTISNSWDEFYRHMQRGLPIVDDGISVLRKDSLD